MFAIFFIVILYLIIYVLFIECNTMYYCTSCIIVLGYSMKVINVFICIIISMKLGKIFIYGEIRCNMKNILSTKF